MHVRIVSPSGAVNPEFIDGAALKLRSWGYEVSESAHCRGRYGRYSGTVEERFTDLQQAIDDPAVDVILCSRGGYGLVQYVDRLDLSELGSKIIVGYSDITALHSALGIYGYPSVHAAMAKGLALDEGTELGAPVHPDAIDPRSVEQLHALLKRGRPSGYCATAAPHWLNRQGRRTGIVRGGNLSVLYGLRGTPFDLPIDRPFGLPFEQPELFPTILFIEDINEAAYHIDRMMQNLRLSGILGKICGLIVGELTDCQDDPAMVYSIQENIAAAVSQYDYPVCFGFPAGHGWHNQPLWLNCQAELEVNAQGTTLTYS